MRGFFLGARERRPHIEIVIERLRLEGDEEAKYPNGNHQRACETLEIICFMPVKSIGASGTIR